MSATDNNGTALITGASTGIGAVYADRLARRGYDLILVARNRERLAALANRLVAETSRSVEILPADLTDKADLLRVEATLRDDPKITMLVNNAGIGSVAPLIKADIGKMEEMITLNITARLCRARPWHHHQHQLDRRYFHRNAERRVWRQQGVCSRFQPFPSA